MVPLYRSPHNHIRTATPKDRWRPVIQLERVAPQWWVFYDRDERITGRNTALLFGATCWIRHIGLWYRHPRYRLSDEYGRRRWHHVVYETLVSIVESLVN